MRPLARAGRLDQTVVQADRHQPGMLRALPVEDRSSVRILHSGRSPRHAREAVTLIVTRLSLVPGRARNDQMRAGLLPRPSKGSSPLRASRS